MGGKGSHNAAGDCMIPRSNGRINARIPLITAAREIFNLKFSRTPNLLAQ
jgi:hypothetical protein